MGTLNPRMSIDPGLFEENEKHQRGAQQGQAAQLGSFELESGGRLESVQAAYHLYGSLDQPVILVCHAISGDSNAAAWWDRLIGPGKALDTDRFALLCSNALGGCRGTTGPSSAAPDGMPYGSRFPKITMGDIVDVQYRLAQHLGIKQFALAAGGSMGGMQALEWSRRHPEMIERVWVTASALHHSAMQIGFNEAARQAILRDPKWNGGDYSADDPPVQGLAIARMMGHLTYLSEAAFEQKFGRRQQSQRREVVGFSVPQLPDYAAFEPFQVESYLQYQGEKFTQRFDAGSFVALSNAIDRYDCDSLSSAKAKFLVTSFTSDWIYPSHQSAAIAALARSAGLPAAHAEIDLPYGHDAFLLDDLHQADLVREFLRS